MRLEAVPLCPIDAAPGPVLYTAIHDAYFGTPGAWTYRRHPATGHLWLDPRPDADALGELYAAYYTHRDSASGPASGGFKRAAQAAARTRRLGYPPEGFGPVARLASHWPPWAEEAEIDVLRLPAARRGRLLDFGCGNGALMARMRNLGWTVLGVEPDPAAATTLAREGLDVHPSLSGLRAAGEAAFDVVVLNHVIEHLPDPVETLTQLRGLLRPQGELILLTPNAAGLGARLFGPHWRGLEPPRHFNVFTPASLRAALNRAGFGTATLNTSTRIAAGVWYNSCRARFGGQRLELPGAGRRRLLAATAYAYQAGQSALKAALPDLGEEILGVARRVSDRF